MLFSDRTEQRVYACFDFLESECLRDGYKSHPILATWNMEYKDLSKILRWIQYFICNHRL